MTDTGGESGHPRGAPAARRYNWKPGRYGKDERGYYHIYIKKSGRRRVFAVQCEEEDADHTIAQENGEALHLRFERWEPFGPPLQNTVFLRPDEVELLQRAAEDVDLDDDSPARCREPRTSPVRYTPGAFLSLAKEAPRFSGDATSWRDYKAQLRAHEALMRAEAGAEYSARVAAHFAVRALDARSQKRVKQVNSIEEMLEALAPFFEHRQTEVSAAEALDKFFGHRDRGEATMRDHIVELTRARDEAQEISGIQIPEAILGFYAFKTAAVPHESRPAFFAALGGKWEAAMRVLEEMWPALGATPAPSEFALPAQQQSGDRQQQVPRPPPTARPCKYGADCRRRETCSFAHTEAHRKKWKKEKDANKQRREKETQRREKEINRAVEKCLAASEKPSGENKPRTPSPPQPAVLRGRANSLPDGYNLAWISTGAPAVAAPSSDTLIAIDSCCTAPVAGRRALEKYRAALLAQGVPERLFRSTTSTPSFFTGIGGTASATGTAEIPVFNGKPWKLTVAVVECPTTPILCSRAVFFADLHGVLAAETWSAPALGVADRKLLFVHGLPALDGLADWKSLREMQFVAQPAAARTRSRRGTASCGPTRPRTRRTPS